jgi:hypothetical protein
MADAGREPWQLERFIALFNEVAAAHKEWPFEETPDRIRSAQQLYERGAPRTLEEFANAWFLFERRS